MVQQSVRSNDEQQRVYGQTNYRFSDSWKTFDNLFDNDKACD